MAILSFSLTADEFLSGKKTVTRRLWSDRHHAMWVRLWDSGRLIHDAWDKLPRAGGKRIGRFRLSCRPYREPLIDMPEQDLIAEGAMCASRDEYYRLIDKSREQIVTVIRFEQL